MERAQQSGTREQLVQIPSGQLVLEGNLSMPLHPEGIVLFAHGSGSSRHSPRNRMVASAFNQDGLGTLLLDLLTRDEEIIDQQTRHLRFDIELLARRLGSAIDWLQSQDETRNFPLGLFGASTGAGAALIAASARPGAVKAVVSRGGRPDLAGLALPRVKAPTLLIVGGHDFPVIGLNREAMAYMLADVRLEIVPGASHLFEERGALEEVARLASSWFRRHLRA